MAKKISLSNNKLRHTTGAYLHLASSPTEEDMIFLLSSKKQKAMSMSDIIKSFGEHKTDAIESVLRLLNTKMLINRSGENNDIISLN